MTQVQTVGRLNGPRDIGVGTAEVPRPGAGDVVIKVACTGICGTDLAFFREGPPVPGAVLGHEFAGTVVAAGADVSGVKVGDRVVANPMVDMLGLGRVDGAFAEYLRLPDTEAGRNIFVIPDPLSDEAGALVEPFAVGLHAVTRSRAQPGEKCTVLGAGPIGLCVIAALRARGVTDILAVDPSEKRRSLALAMGAAAVHDPAAGDTAAFVTSHFGADKVPFAQRPVALGDVAFDCAGVTATLSDGLHALATRGRLVVVADPHHLVLPDLRLVMLRELEVIGAVGYEHEFAQALDLLASGAVDLSPLITHRFPLSRLDEAFAMQMNARDAVKVIVSTEG